MGMLEGALVRVQRERSAKPTMGPYAAILWTHADKPNGPELYPERQVSPASVPNTFSS